MTNDESEGRPHLPRLVSVNADRNIDIHRAKQRVATKLANLAAAVLRNIAGSPSAAPIMQCALDYFDAQEALVALTGDWFPHEEEKLALSLVEAQPPSSNCDTRYREFEHAVGIEQIIRGALRSASHQILKEREPFGGKYSTGAIEEGIALVVRATRGPPSRKGTRRNPPGDLADEY